MKIETLVKNTAGMNPVQFEEYCDYNQIQIDWLDVNITDFNEGYYNVVLPKYNDISVFAVDGSPVEIDYNELF
jgi:hypothetical protein